jgi:hypothetical protein
VVGTNICTYTVAGFVISNGEPLNFATRVLLGYFIKLVIGLVIKFRFLAHSTVNSLSR